MSDYQWKANICCIATYKTLEGDNMLDQFEASYVSFEQAPSIEMGQLRYYPKTTNNPDIIELIAYEMARKFLKLIVVNYSVAKENSELSTASIIIALAEVFKTKDATINDLAAVTDKLIKFADEKVEQ